MEPHTTFTLIPCSVIMLFLISLTRDRMCDVCLARAADHVRVYHISPHAIHRTITSSPTQTKCARRTHTADCVRAYGAHATAIDTYTNASHRYIHIICDHWSTTTQTEPKQKKKQKKNKNTNKNCLHEQIDSSSVHLAEATC